MTSTLLLKIRKEYTEHLIDILVPFIYEGLQQIYQDTRKMVEETKKTDSILIIFQKLLILVPKWNKNIIIDETNRIREKSQTSEYFNELIKVVIKSSINVLTYDPYGAYGTYDSKIGQNFYENIDIPNFIHKCYIECAKEAYNRSYLFYHDVDAMEYKKNQNAILDLIKVSIKKAIRKMLPIKNILYEYMQINFNNLNGPKIELVGNNSLPVGNNSRPIVQHIANPSNVTNEIQHQINNNSTILPIGNKSNATNASNAPNAPNAANAPNMENIVNAITQLDGNTGIHEHLNNTNINGQERSKNNKQEPINEDAVKSHPIMKFNKKIDGNKISDNNNSVYKPDIHDSNYIKEMLKFEKTIENKVKSEKYGLTIDGNYLVNDTPNSSSHGTLTSVNKKLINLQFNDEPSSQNNSNHTNHSNHSYQSNINNLANHIHADEKHIIKNKHNIPKNYTDSTASQNGEIIEVYSNKNTQMERKGSFSNGNKSNILKISK
jgi:hypothetical protein